MGLISRVLGAGAAVGSVAEVLVGNRAERDAAASRQHMAAVEQFAGEFGPPAARFDGFVNGLNRLPRPMLALGTLGLFAYAMAEPAGFSTRMRGLALVPEPLWWLLGAIVSFYFGARELHHLRGRALALPRIAAVVARTEPPPSPAPLAIAVPAADPDHNAAVEEWRRQRA